MKKHILLFLLFTGFLQAQTYPVNPTKFGKISLNTNVEDNSAGKISVQSSTNEINWLLPVNIPINQPPHPINYTASTPTLGAHLIGIDTRLGTIVQTTAGTTARVFFTGETSVVNSVTYYNSSLTGKGSVASVNQTVVNPDDTRTYFAQDVISVAQVATTISAAGTYAGQLTVRVSDDSAQEKFGFEVYKTNSLGVPIASGITGAPVGSLGVTVVAILDSGVIDLVQNSTTNVSVSGVLASPLTLNTGERIRYHAFAEKVGTAGASFTYTLYYGNNNSSYYDVPVTPTTDTVINKSLVTGATTTDALNTLNAAIPVNYSKIVYVDNNNPNIATIFDLNNPPVTNDNLLKTDVNNLYIGLDASTWVYNATTVNYITKTVTSSTSNFYLAGTTTDAGNSKTAAISRTGTFSGLLELTTNPLGSTLNRIGQTMTNTDNWRIYGDAASSDLGIMVFEVGDNSVPGINSQRFEFRYKSPSGTGDITPFTINYDAITSTLPLTATSFIKTGGLVTEALLANGGVLSNPISGTGTTNYISKWSATGVQANSRMFDNGTNFVGINSTTPYSASMGQTLNINATGTDQYSTLELVGNTSVNGNRLGLIQFANNNGALGSAFIYATRENSNSTYGDLHFDVRGAGGYLSNAFRISSAGALSMSVAPTTSAGTYDILTRNTSTGVVEKVASSAFVIDIVEVSKTASFSVALVDSGKTYIINSASPVVVTFPTAMTAGKWWEFINIGTGDVSFVAGASATLVSPDSRLKLRTQYSQAKIIARASNIGVLGGDIVL